MAKDASTDDAWKAEPVEGPVDGEMAWGSDMAAQMLRRLDIPYVALTPGASYRGLHDSLVNHLGNERPEIVLCLHEEHAVAVAHGYAKATGRALAVVLHSNVGLLHGSMAMFNAWADRVPMLVLGATGPTDAAERRPWIDWLHTTQDQGALVRSFTKWDDQPGSAAAAATALMRAWKITNTAPRAPVYVNLDASWQEAPAPEGLTLPDPARHAVPAVVRPDPARLTEAARALDAARRPVILFGRGARTAGVMATRVALAERLGAPMLSDLKAGAMVPSDHPNHVGQPFNKLSPEARTVLAEADAILSLGAVDLGGVLKQGFGAEGFAGTVIHASEEAHLHRGLGQEHYDLAPIDIEFLADPDATAEDLVEALGDGARPAPALPASSTTEPPASGTLTQRDIARALKAEIGDAPVTFPALSRGWPTDLWPHREPLDFLGKDGGGGIGSGPGLTVGAALALKGSGRLVVATLGDGDTLMGINAFWTAAKYRLPLLAIIANNRSYFNDELHQESVARRRGRVEANAWVGQKLDDPAPDIAGLARAQGLGGVGPVRTQAELQAAMAEGVAAVREGRPFLIDVWIDARQGREQAVARNTKSGV